MTGTHASETNRCSLCGGDYGALWDGAHALCRERAKRGYATPNPGKRCSVCNGAGR